MKKLPRSTPPKAPDVRKTGFFPCSRVYTEKMSLQIHFFAINGVLAHIFSVYALLPRTNRAKRGKIAK